MESSKLLYLPLNQDPLLNESDDVQKQLQTHAWASRSSIFSKRNLIVLVLALSNIVFLSLHLYEMKAKQSPPGYARIDPMPIKWTRFDWWTEYSEKNDTEVDALWDAILPSHGFVAMDRRWAEGRNWPDTMRLPSDQSKGVYLLEAYHQIHCIKIVRKTFWELVKGEPVTYPVSHSGHCFDMIRQSIQCNADNTPLYVFGDDTAGDMQLHKCRDWNALRDFATKHTACYRDSVKPILLGEHFGYCDDGNDGVIEAKRANVTVEENS